MKPVDLISAYNFISLPNFEKFLFSEKYIFSNGIEQYYINYVFDKIPIFDSIFFELNTFIFKEFFIIQNIK
jgi:hypothetical protein